MARRYPVAEPPRLVHAGVPTASGGQHRACGAGRPADPAQRTPRGRTLRAARAGRLQVVATVPTEDPARFRRPVRPERPRCVPTPRSPGSAFLSEIVLPQRSASEPLVHLTGVAIGVCLPLGLLSRLGALLRVAMGLNPWLGLYLRQASCLGPRCAWSSPWPRPSSTSGTRAWCRYGAPPRGHRRGRHRRISRVSSPEPAT